MNDLFDVSGKVVLVTGGSRGIGEMIARGFVEAGATVYISSRKADVGEALAKELSKFGSCTSLPADLSSEAECQRLATEFATHESHLDVLVNNAGATWGAPMNEYDEKAFERVLALNVKGVFHLTKFLRPLLEKSGTPANPSRVINIGSIDGLHVPGNGDVRVFRLEGRRTSANATLGEVSGAERDRECDCARPV